MDAIVVGGGIGGLATALGLARQGWRVTVRERQPELAAVGAGLSLWPNAVHALRWLGVGDAVVAAGSRLDAGGVRSASGAWLQRLSLGTRLGAPLVVVHRADLHEILAGALPSTVTVQTGAPVVDVASLDADLVVGADGIGSAVRTAYAPEIRIRDSGQVSWRAIVPGPPLTTGGETMGPGGWRFGAVSTGRRGTYWYAAAPGPLRTSDPAEQLAELRSAFAGWHEPIPQLLAATDPAVLLHHPLLDLHPVAPMRFGARTALVGDAAHAMTPNLGQGACQALEDAVTLAGLPPAGAQVGSALARYDAMRRPRVAMVSRRSWQVGRLVGASGRLSGAVARATIRLVPDRLAASNAAAVASWRPPTPAPTPAPV